MAKKKSAPLDSTVDRLTQSAVELGLAFADELQRRDPDRYARMTAAVSQGMQLSVAVVTGANRTPEIRFEIIDHAGDRLTLAHVPGRMSLNA